MDLSRDYLSTTIILINNKDRGFFMGKDIKFGYFYNPNGFNIHIREFERSFLREEARFIQIQINEEDYIRVGHLYHRTILRETLDEFGLKFKIRLNREYIDIPLERGDNYNLIGAGKICFFGEKLNFYDASADYLNHVAGTNGQNLEKIFGEENVTEVEGDIEPSFLVRI
jgi:hypothetical protein